jgi:hypothetical protein
MKKDNGVNGMKAKVVQSTKHNKDDESQYEWYKHPMLVMTVCIAVAFRCAIALGPYSGLYHRIVLLFRYLTGMSTPPMYGDYEAQRHWMEITYHTPVREWYWTTANNNLSYWGLDYPPLTAYHSWIMGALYVLWISILCPYL